MIIYYYLCRNNLSPPWDTNNALPSKESLKIVSTRSKASISKQVKARSKGIAVNKVDLTAILEGRSKRQQEFAYFKKQSSDEMEALK